jgi:hypothetical protein
VTPRKRQPAKARYEELRERWERVHAAEQRVYHRPPAGSIRNALAWMRWLAAATRDPVLAATAARIETMIEGFGFDKGLRGVTGKRLQSRIEAEHLKQCLPRMDELVNRDRGALSVREAAAEVAAMRWLPGASFVSVTTLLRAEYRKAGLKYRRKPPKDVQV